MVMWNNEKGVSLIAAIFIIIVLALMGVAFVSLISSSSLTAINDMQSMQALALAEGGVEFEQYNLAQDLDWYRSSADPIVIPPKNAGAGSFAASVRMPATMLRRMLRTGDATAAVYTTAGFPASGYLQIGDDVGSGAEFVQYTILNGNTFTLVAPRGRTIGTLGTAAATFPRATRVYPVAQLSAGIANSTSSPATITITANAKFLSAGTVDIEGEEISFSGSSTSGGVTTLSGIQRCIAGTTCAAHAVSQPVTPVLFGGASADMQSEITSTGMAGPAIRIVKKTVQR